jgi:altronate dehydratase small subunit
VNRCHLVPDAPPADRADALLLNPSDDVAMALRAIAPGERCKVQAEGEIRFVQVNEAIPFGHKFSVHAISEGSVIRKYGTDIGAAREPIAPGAHVHTHNLVSLRGRR